MRQTNAIMEELKDLEGIISKGLEIQKTYPDDFVLNMSLEDDQKRYDKLLLEFQEALMHEGRHFIRFVIQNIGKYSAVSIDRFFDSIQALQDIIAQLSKVIFHQEKNNMELSFNTTFPSSFGVLLSLTYKDQELISKTYLSLERTFAILNSLNNDELLMDILNEDLKNKRLLYKFRKFYQTQSNYSNDIELTWGDTSKNYHSAKISHTRMSYIADTLSKYEILGDEEIIANCVVKGISLVKKKIELEYNRRIITAKATEEIIMKAGNFMNKPIEISAIIHRRINEMIDDIEEKWEVIGIR